MILFNGKLLAENEACFKYNDRGLNVGHGLFETILVKKNQLPALIYHWERLKSSAEKIGITLPFSVEEFAEMICYTIEKNNLQDKIAGARLTLTAGYGPRGLLPSQSIKPNFVISVFEQISNPLPYSAGLVSIKKNEHAFSSQIKSTNYLDNIFAKQQAANQGYDEAILLNTASNIADGAISTLFIIKAKEIFTPPHY